MRLIIKWVCGWAQIHGSGPNGERIRRSLKTQDAVTAEQARAQLETKLWRLHVYGPESVTTFAEAALSYAEDGGEAKFLVPITEKLGERPLREITPSMVRSAAKAAYPKAANATVNRQAITPARAVINYAHAQGWCPPIKVKGFPMAKPRREAVDTDYMDRLRPHLPASAYALMLFLPQTGRRVSEAIELTPDRLRGDRAFIPRTKNGAEAWAHLTPELQELIAALTPRHGLVFGYVHRSSLYSTLRRACAKAGLPYLGTHQPGRHSFATSLAGAGFSTKEIAEAGGWKTTRMVAEIYEHPEAIQQRAAGHFSGANGKKLASPVTDPLKIVQKQ
jgi:integrase